MAGREHLGIDSGDNQAVDNVLMAEIVGWKREFGMHLSRPRRMYRDASELRFACADDTWGNSGPVPYSEINGSGWICKGVSVCNVNRRNNAFCVSNAPTDSGESIEIVARFLRRHWIFWYICEIAP